MFSSGGKDEYNTTCFSIMNKRPDLKIQMSTQPQSGTLQVFYETVMYKTAQMCLTEVYLCKPKNLKSTSTKFHKKLWGNKQGRVFLQKNTQPQLNWPQSTKQRDKSRQISSKVSIFSQVYTGGGMCVFYRKDKFVELFFIWPA